MTGGATAAKKPRVLLVDDRADNLLALEAVLVSCDDLGAPGDVDVPDDLPARLRRQPT